MTRRIHIGFVAALVFAASYGTSLAQWTQTNGPFGGSVRSFASSGGTIFAGTEHGGVFLSTNSGLSWAPANAGLTGLSVYALAVSGTNLFAGTPSSGIFRSTNGGATWTSVNVGLSNINIYSLLVAGTNLFAGTLGGGIFRSSNNGANWAPVSQGLTNLNVVALVSMGNYLLAGTSGGGVYRSANNGASWVQLNQGLTNLNVSAFAVSGANILTGTNGGGVYTSADSGAVWRPSNTGLQSFSITSLLANGANVYAGTMFDGVYRSTTGGNNWQQISQGILHNIYALGMSATSLFAGSHGGGVYVSNDGGNIWNQAIQGLVNSGVSSLVMSGANTFAGVYGGGMYVSSNDGLSWNPRNAGLGNPFVQAVATSGTNLYAGTDNGFFHSTDNGTIWFSSQGLIEANVLGLHVNGPTLFAGTGGDGVYRSSDSGITWIPVNTGLQNLVINSFATIGANTFAATAGGGVYRTTNAGGIWTEANAGLNSLFVKSLANKNALLFAGTFNGVYASTNNGVSWSPANQGLPQNGVEALFVNGESLFASLFGGGVFVSTNNGVNWIPVQSGLPNNEISSFVAGGQYLFAGTKGSGVWRRLLADFVPVFTTATNNVQFGGVPVGLIKVDTSIIITNTGGLPLAVSTVVVPGTGIFTISPETILIQPSVSQRFFTTFRPNAAGALNASVVFAHNGASQQDTITLAGTGLVPLFSTTRPSLNYGDVRINTSKLDSITVTNLGSASLNITNVQSTNGRFVVIPPTTAVLDSGASRTFFVTFTPNALGTTSGNIIFTHNASGSPSGIPVTGVGVAPSFALSLTQVNFGNAVVNTTSIDTSVVVVNSGGFPLTISSVTRSDTQFTITPTSATVAATGGTRRFSITFRPNSVGPKISTFIFSHDAAGSPDTVTAVGTGVISTFSVAPTSLIFGNVTVGSNRVDTVAVTNSGNFPISITSVVSGNAQFTVTPTSSVVPVLGIVKFAVRYTPTASGGVSSSIAFHHNAVGSPTGVGVSGTGLSPVFSPSTTNLNFGDVLEGTSRFETLTVTNPGNVALFIPTIVSTNAQYAVNRSSDTLAPGTSRVYTIQFIATSPGLVTGNIRFTHNAPGSPSDISVSANVFGSLVQPQVSGDLFLGSTINVSVNEPPNFPVTRAVLNYRKGGKTVFDTLSLVRSGQTFAGAFPESVITPRGIEYFVSLVGLQETLNSPTDVVRTRVRSLFSPLHFERKQYKMISIPLTLDDAHPGTQLSDNYGSYNPLIWRLFHHRNGSNVEFPSITEDFQPGNAFWLITQSGEGFDAKAGTSVTLVSDSMYAIRLHPGWNQISSPFAFEVAWQGIENTKSLDVEGPHFFNGTEFEFNKQTLKPWEGYFVFNRSLEAVHLGVYPVEASTSTPPAPKPFPLEDDLDFAVQLSAATGDLRDTYNYVGLLERALADQDRTDMVEPPRVGSYVDLSIEQDEKEFAGNFKPISTEGQQWEMKLSSNVANRTVTVTVREIGVLPPGFELYILDQDEFAAVPLSGETFSVQLGAAQSFRSFRVIIGTKAFAEQVSGGISLTPIGYSLGQNYPNPFNPSTTIRYSLSKRSLASLEIFNALGQKVRTLVRGEQLTGSYSIVWDGLSDSGVQVSSGVYIYSLQAGEYRSSKKLLLLR